MLRCAGAPPEALSGLERAAAALALEGASLALATGRVEGGLAAVQALLEFSTLSPQGWPDDALLLMFGECWGSGAALAGEPGASGWGKWIEGAAQGRPEDDAAEAAAAAERRRQRRERDEVRQRSEQEAAAAAAAEEERAGGSGDAGLSGWVELAPAIRARFGHSLDLSAFAAEPAGEAGKDGGGGEEAAAAIEGSEERDDGDDEAEDEPEEEAEEPEEEAEEPEETDEQLLARLGLDLDAALEAEATLTPPLMAAWLAEERRREARQWQPARGAAPSGASPEEVLRHVPWEDVRPLLLPLASPAARQDLVAGCLQLLGVPLPGVALATGSAAGAGLAGAADELWRAADAAGVGAASQAPAWVREQLAQGDWGWLQGGGSLREEPWYRVSSAAGRRELCSW